MCDIPGHPKGDPDHNLLHAIDRKLDNVVENQAAIMSDLYGNHNKPGLIKNVQDIREGRVTDVRKESSMVSAGVAMIVAAIVSVLQIFGWVPNGQQ